MIGFSPYEEWLAANAPFRVELVSIPRTDGKKFLMVGQKGIASAFNDRETAEACARSYTLLGEDVQERMAIKIMEAP